MSIGSKVRKNLVLFTDSGAGLGSLVALNITRAVGVSQITPSSLGDTCFMRLFRESHLQLLRGSLLASGITLPKYTRLQKHQGTENFMVCISYCL